MTCGLSRRTRPMIARAKCGDRLRAAEIECQISLFMTLKCENWHSTELRVTSRQSLAAKQEQQIEAIRAVLEQRTDGASLEQIEAAVSVAMSRRTLIRCLASMVAQRLVEKSGASRATRYRLPATPLIVRRRSETTVTQSAHVVPRSKAAGETSGLSRSVPNAVSRSVTIAHFWTATRGTLLGTKSGQANSMLGAKFGTVSQRVN